MIIVQIFIKIYILKKILIWTISKMKPVALAVSGGLVGAALYYASTYQKIEINDTILSEYNFIKNDQSLCSMLLEPIVAFINVDASSSYNLLSCLNSFMQLVYVINTGVSCPHRSSCCWPGSCCMVPAQLR